MDVERENMMEIKNIRALNDKSHIHNSRNIVVERFANGVW